MPKQSQTDLLELRASLTAGPQPHQIEIIAYGGEWMQPPGWPTVAVDISAIEHKPRVAVLLDHDASIRSTAGGATVTEAGQRLVLSATIADTDAGRELVSLLQADTPLEASIGLRVIKSHAVRDGETVSINGRNLTAGRGHKIVTQSVLKEITVTPLGADSTTAVRLVANKGKEIMDDQQHDDNTTDQTQLTNDQFKALAAAAKGDPSLLTAAIDGGWSVERLELEQLKASLRTQPHSANSSRSGAPRATNETLACAFMQRAGLGHYAEKSFDANVLNAAESYAKLPLIDALRCTLQADGLSAMTLSPTEVLRASMATSAVSMPNALGLALDKSALRAYEEYPSTWRPIAMTRAPSTFRTQTGIRPDARLDFLQLGPSGELQHGVLTEGTVQYAVRTYGRMLVIQREAIINDDLQILADLAPALGRAASRRVSDLFWGTVLSNLEFDGATAFFSTAHGNLLSGAGSALGAGGLAGAIEAFRTMKTPAGDLANSVPSYLVVPASLEMTARALLSSMELMRNPNTVDDGAPTGNPYRDAGLKLIVEPRLGDSAFNANASDTAWYLCGSGAMSAFLVAFLNGRMGPVVESDDRPDFSTLSFAWRGFIDVGVSLVEPVFGLMNAGA